MDQWHPNQFPYKPSPNGTLRLNRGSRRRSQAVKILNLRSLRLGATAQRDLTRLGRASMESRDGRDG